MRGRDNWADHRRGRQPCTADRIDAFRWLSEISKGSWRPARTLSDTNTANAIHVMPMRPDCHDSSVTKLAM